MAKSNTTKKVKPSAPPPAAKRAKPKAAKSPPSYYLVAAALSCEVTDKKPAADIQARQFANFDDARLAAIDSLVDVIEAAESRLHALKRATSLAQCRAAKS